MSSNIEKNLEEMGYSLSYEKIDDGSYKEFSKWWVVVTLPKGRIETEYQQGSAHRQLKSGPYPPGMQEIARKYRQQKQRYNHISIDRRKMTVLERDFLLFYTEAIPPTLEDVVYSLVSDAGIVAYSSTFDEFCDDFGYSNDSISAKQCYDSSCETHRKLLISGDFEKLQELFEDY